MMVSRQVRTFRTALVASWSLPPGLHPLGQRFRTLPRCNRRRPARAALFIPTREMPS